VASGRRIGHIVTEETRKKISKTLIGKPNPHKGEPLLEETKRKMSEADKKKIGEKNPFYGKHHSEEAKSKMSKTKKGKYYPKMKGRTGEKSGRWKGGITKQKGYGTFMVEKRRVKKLGNGGSHTLGEWENLKAQYNWTCPMCGRSEPKIKLTEDHIVPLSKGGSDNIENIQPLCGSCNSKKNTKIFRVNPDGSLKLF
jgi:hypothetical protein